MKKILIVLCVICLLIELFLIVKNYINKNPIATNVVLLLGFLGTLYFISGKDNVKKSD